MSGLRNYSDKQKRETNRFEKTERSFCRRREDKSETRRGDRTYRSIGKN